VVPKQRKEVFRTALLLFLGTLALYYPALHNGFVNYDDPAYVTANPHVQQGLTPNTVRWAFAATSEANWHPLTWISHALDVSLFGLAPAGHHAQSIIFHAFNVALLFLLLVVATGFPGRSALVAALFACHPLNVESVAWVAERKTVLSTFFLLLAVAAYGWYAKKPRADRYLLVAVCFSFGLMAKPIVITLPFALLLLDFWPLERFPGTSLSKLVVEKIPLFVLSGASAAITLDAQHAGGAVGAAELLPLAFRLKNAVWSYLIYIEKTVWPSRLAVFYPHPESSLDWWQVALAALILILITIAAWHFRSRRYLVTGWFWFIGTLVPVIGIVQVGRQAWADRYAYFSIWGLFVIAVWLLSEALGRLHPSRTVPTLIALAVLSAYASAALVQIGYWKNSYTLFSHAIAVTENNGVAEGNLGAALLEIQRPDLALPHLERAIRWTPTLATPHYNLGTILQRQNQFNAAGREYEAALKYSADALEAAHTHNNLGALFQQMGRPEQAVAEYSEAIRLDPGEQNSWIGRGLIERQQGQLDAALQDFAQAVRLKPSPAALYWQGQVLEAQGRNERAAAAYQAALQLVPDFTDAQLGLDRVTKATKK